MNPMDIKWKIKEYYEQLYIHKFDNVDEIDQFLERYNLTKLTQEEVNNVNRPIFIKSIESTINDIPKENAIGPDGFTGKFYQTFKE